jgi:hypothetical protein
MIRTLATAVFALALASAAQAMPFGSVHQPDGMFTLAAAGCGAGMTMVNGKCVSRVEKRHARRCLRWNGSTCAQYQ